jgi:hypothetical protein
MGATFTEMMDEPERLFTDAGYSMLALDSVPLYSMTRKNMRIPAFLIKHVMRTLRDGYLIGAFQTTNA